MSERGSTSVPLRFLLLFLTAFGVGQAAGAAGAFWRSGTATPEAFFMLALGGVALILRGVFAVLQILDLLEARLP